jgi:hypothetical protein
MLQLDSGVAGTIAERDDDSHGDGDQLDDPRRLGELPAGRRRGRNSRRPLRRRVT